MNVHEKLALVMIDCEALNGEIRESLNKITIVQAREIVKACHEAEGWLAGIRKVLLMVED